jgi:hypothetical protein
VTLLDDPHRVIVTIETHGPMVEEVPAAAAPVEAEVTEPEVIRRGKVVEEAAE